MPFLVDLITLLGQNCQNFGALCQLWSDFHHLNIFRWTKTGKIRRFRTWEGEKIRIFGQNIYPY